METTRRSNANLHHHLAHAHEARERASARRVMLLVVVLIVLTFALHPLLVRAQRVDVAATEPNTPATELNVMVIQHTYDGPVLRTGQFRVIRYGASGILLEYQAYGDGDKLFRGAFECPNPILGACYLFP